MILTGILRTPKSKIILLILVFVYIYILLFFSILPKRSKDYFLSDYLNNELSSKEFITISGSWSVTGFLGESVKFHEEEFSSESEIMESDKIYAETMELYLNKTLDIDKKHITEFYPPDELGYYVSTWSYLFGLYRQPSDIWDSLSPPFLCVSFKLKYFSDSLVFIMDCGSKESVLVVNGLFFALERVELD